MPLDSSSRDDVKERTRWWAVGVALGLTGLVAWMALGYYKSAVPRGHFEDGVLAIREGKWMNVRRAATALKASPDFLPHLSYLEAALEANDQDFETAAKYLTRALENPEVRPMALAMSGMLDYRDGDFEAARAKANEALKLVPELPEATQLLAVLEDADQPMARVARAMMALDNNDPTTVEAELKALKETESGTRYAEFVAGVILMRRNQYDQALEMFGRAQEISELAVQCYILSAEALIRSPTPDPASAVGLLNRAISIEPDAVDAHRWLADIFYNQGLDSLAVVHLRRVAELDPSDFRAPWKMGLMNFDFQDWQGALGHFDQALACNPPLPIQVQILLGKARSLVKLARFEEARAILVSPIFTEVTDPQIRAQADVTLAQCEFDAGRGDEALRLVRTVLERNPTDLEALTIKGMVELDKRNPAVAAQTLRTAVNVDPYDYLARYQLSLALQAAGEVDAARNEAAEANRLKALREEFSQLHEEADVRPGDVPIRLRLGEVALELGQPEMALNWYRAVQTLEPENPQAARRIDELTRAPAPRQ
ncbi:MAG TPA: hypothetical protein DCQ98_10925 [Planctomycetaceae bacterium]|nr:hypothetical protein [Planctomycetaceae bacterium]HRF01117.1 tetratricopeptide repeat protein [Pirellulaceae bacterium]